MMYQFKCLQDVHQRRTHQSVVNIPDQSSAEKMYFKFATRRRLYIGAKDVISPLRVFFFPGTVYKSSQQRRLRPYTQVTKTLTGASDPFQVVYNLFFYAVPHKTKSESRKDERRNLLQRTPVIFVEKTGIVFSDIQSLPQTGNPAAFFQS